jgi:5'-3' exonuclease
VCGDSADNLKGIPKIGPKGFIKLIENNFASLNDIQREIFEKHKIVVGLRNNPNLQKNIYYIDKILYNKLI